MPQLPGAWLLKVAMPPCSAVTNFSLRSAHSVSRVLRSIACTVQIPGLALWVPTAVFVWGFGASPTQCAFFGVLAVCAPLLALSEVSASPARITRRGRWLDALGELLRKESPVRESMPLTAYHSMQPGRVFSGDAPALDNCDFR